MKLFLAGCIVVAAGLALAAASHALTGCPLVH